MATVVILKFPVVPFGDFGIHVHVVRLVVRVRMMEINNPYLVVFVQVAKILNRFRGE